MQEKVNETTELLALDSSLHLFRLRQHNKTFEKVMSLKLSHFSELRLLLQTRKPFENVYLSSRTVAFRNRVFFVASGESFSPFSDEHLEGDDNLGGCSELMTMPEPHGNSIIYQSPNGSKQVVQSDHSRRGLAFAHPQLMNNLASWH